MIELCGGFRPIWIAKVSEAVNNVVPVGSVSKNSILTYARANEDKRIHKKPYIY